MTWIREVLVSILQRGQPREGRASRGRLLAVMILLALIAGVLPNSLMARSYSHKKHSNQAAAKAAKQRTIQAIQNQVNAAKQVLQTVESKAAVSQQQLADAQKLMQDAKAAAESAEAEEDKCEDAVKEVETQIVNENGTDSEIGKAQAALVKAREEMERIRQGIRESLADSSEGSVSAVVLKRNLDESDDYRQALTAYQEAKKEFERVRKEVMQQNPKWQEAADSLQKARQDSVKADRDEQLGRLRAVPAKKNLRTAESVAAMARATIAAGEARLRQLGVKNVGSSQQASRANSQNKK